ncbi:MAG TPA: VOC family protein [Urbifossiella sp.]|nr:VOC family protein [Urbifossiella sp.]
MAVQPIPAGYHTATIYLIVKGAAKALEFYKKAFGAVEIMRFEMADGRLGHAEMKIGDSPIMLADEFPEMGHKSPSTLGGCGTGIMLYVKECDAMYNAAVAAGATVVKPLENQFYGDRSGTVLDPFGHQWTISTHIEDVSDEEMKRRHDEMMKPMGGAK